MPLILAALLGLAGLWIVIAPLLARERAPEDAGWPAPRAELADGERLAREALRDVEFDHSLGNLDDADYAALRDRYERRALAALKQRYSRERELDARIERELAALRARAQAEVAAPAAGPSTTTAASAVRPRAPRPAVPRGPQSRRRKGQ